MKTMQNFKFYFAYRILCRLGYLNYNEKFAISLFAVTNDSVFTI
jgi:hypothetical protein